MVETVRVGGMVPIDAVVEALLVSVSRPTMAIESGGSAGEWCRCTLGHSPTIVQTPMEFVFQVDVDGHDVWLFSAGADNPNPAAAFNAAVRCIVFLTGNSWGMISLAAEALRNRSRAIVADLFYA